MDRKQVIEQLQAIFCDVFDNDEIEITEDSVAEDIDEWDSLGHIQLVKELEKVFSIKFTSKEIMSWENVGEMIDSILNRI